MVTSSTVRDGEPRLPRRAAGVYQVASAYLEGDRRTRPGGARPRVDGADPTRALSA